LEPFDLRQWPRFVSAGGDPSHPAIIHHVAIHSHDILAHASTLFVALRGKQTDGHAYVADAAQRGATFAIVNHSYSAALSVPCTFLRVEDPLTALQELAALYRQQLSTTVIGITGSYGKTTTKDLLSHLLRPFKRVTSSPESFNSQLGVALSLFRIGAQDEIALIEAGISREGEMERLAHMIAPNHALLTTIEQAHLETLQNLETIAREKSKLLQAVSTGKWTLVPDENTLSTTLRADSFGWRMPHPSLPHVSQVLKQGKRGTLYHLRFPNHSEFTWSYDNGFPHLIDVLNRAIKAAWLLGANQEIIQEGVKSYVPESIRTEIWKSPVGATFINDSYCADPLSVQGALKLLHASSAHRRKVFVFGGMHTQSTLPTSSYTQLAEAISRSHIDMLILTDNQVAAKLQPLLTQMNPQQLIKVCPEKEAFVHDLRTELGSNVAVLLKGAKQLPLEELSEQLTEGISSNRLNINFDAIRFNIEAFRQHLPPRTRIMAMVKACAYGTDNTILSQFLAHCNIDIVGVAHVNEAINLRLAGIKQSIFVIHCAQYEVPQAVKWDLEVSAHDEHFIHALQKEASKQGKTCKVHLHVDTGMTRLGCRPEEALSLATLISTSSHLCLEGIMTHFAAAADASKDAFTAQQIHRFSEVVQSLQKAGLQARWTHAANSSGAIRFSLPNCNMVRIGLGLYGIHESEKTRQQLSLRPALSLLSRIAAVNICNKGDTISYGGTYTVTHEQERIGVVPLGYFDGLHRHYSNKGHVLVLGHPAPIVGTICMDFLMINLTDIPEAAVNDKVLIFGNDPNGYALPVETFAAQADGSVYELITCLGPRIQRVFVYDAQAREYVMN
jgi:Alr-MurF fusion protein